MRIRGKTALLAGAGPGMGRATAQLFAQEGARVAVGSRTIETGQETVRRVLSQGGVAECFSVDLTQREAVDEMVADLVKRWGKLDVVYFGAGGFFNPGVNFEKMEVHPEPFFDLAVANTLMGLYNLAQAVRPFLSAGGSFITVSASEQVLQAGNPAYAAVKSGVIGLTRRLAKEFYPDGVRVNSIGSGLIRAPQREGPVAPVEGLYRQGHPEDIAYAALYLASDESSWVTGQVLGVDGGVDVGARSLWELEK